MVNVLYQIASNLFYYWCCRRLLWLIFIHFSCSRKKCWLFSLLETHFFASWWKENLIFSRAALQKSTLESSYTYVVKAWKMNSDVIYHKEPGWCSVSICCCQELKESSKNSHRCSMTFKNKVHYGPEYIWLCSSWCWSWDSVIEQQQYLQSPWRRSWSKIIYFLGLLCYAESSLSFASSSSQLLL